MSTRRLPQAGAVAQRLAATAVRGPAPRIANVPAPNPSASPAGLNPVLLASWVALGVFGLVSIAVRPENSDMSWLYHVATQVLRGDRLGVDVVDPNPPPIVWLNVPVVLAGRLLGLSPDAVYRAAVVLTGLASLLFCWRLYPRAVPHAPGVESRLAGLWLFFVLLVLPGANFGEREHVFVLLIMPYLFVAAGRISGARIAPREALTAGVLAGIGCSIKPFFPPVIIGMEAVRLARGREWRRWVSPEGALATAVVAAAAAATLAFEPGYLRFMRSFGAGVYAHFRPVPMSVIVREPRFLLGLAGVLVFWLSRPLPRHRPIGFGFSIAALVASIAVLVQQKGFAYHYLPAVQFASLLLPLALIGPRVRLGGAGRGARAIDGAGWALLALAVCGGGVRAYGAVRDRLGPREAARAAVERCVQRLAQGRPVLVLSSDIGAAFPSVREAGAVWPVPFASIWPLYAAYAEDFGWATGVAGPGWRPDRAEAYVADGISRALRVSRPALILVDERTLETPIGRKQIDMLPVLESHADVRNALVGYRTAGRVGGMRLLLPDSAAAAGAGARCRDAAR